VEKCPETSVESSLLGEKSCKPVTTIYNEIFVGYGS